jgi:RNA 2',3'-cyclic 3'-phosphodiesterase
MSTNGTFRAFYAVPFEAAVAGTLEEAAREAVGNARGWRVTPAERIHLTLKFLGDVPLDLVSPLTEALEEEAAVPPFPVTLGGWIPMRGVLSVGVSDPTGSLPRLATALEARAEALGVPPESRPFLPHVTVARNRVRTVPPPAPRKGTDALAEAVVDRMVLMRSTLGPQGPTYAAVAEARLADNRRQR